MNLRWKKSLFSSGKFAKNWNFKENHKKGFFLFKIKIFLDQKLWKNPKNSKNQAKIDNVMNFSSSLRWIFIAKIFFTAMNSLLVSHCRYKYNYVPIFYTEILIRRIDFMNEYFKNQLFKSKVQCKTWCLQRKTKEKFFVQCLENKFWMHIIF